MRKIILFDIDYVLINSAKLRAETREKISLQLNLPLGVIEDLYFNFENTLGSLKKFSPKKYAKFLAEKLENGFVKNEVIKIYFKNSDIYQQAIYPEVVPVFEKLELNYRLGIYSEGVKEFQMTKLTFSGIINYLHKDLIFIYPDKTGKVGELVEKFGEICFVDDNPRHIKDIVTTKSAHPVWLKRGPKAQTEEKLDCPTILSLEELNLYQFLARSSGQL